VQSIVISVFVCLYVCLSVAYLNKSSAVAEMGDRDHNRHGPKTGGCAPLRGELGFHLTQRRLGRGLPPYLPPYLPRNKWHLDPCSRLATIDLGRNWVGGAVPFFYGELGPPLTQSRLGRGLPSYQVHLSPSSRLTTTDRGRKFGACPFRGGGAGSPSKTMSLRLRPTSVPSGILMHTPVWPQ